MPWHPRVVDGQSSNSATKKQHRSDNQTHYEQYPGDVAGSTRNTGKPYRACDQRDDQKY